jgi:hypothetical protein
MYNTFMWNWSKSILCEDALFIKSCINDAFGNEIQWPMPKAKIFLGIQLQELLGCIGFINNNLVRTKNCGLTRHIKLGSTILRKTIQ